MRVFLVCLFVCLSSKTVLMIPKIFVRHTSRKRGVEEDTD